MPNELRFLMFSPSEILAAIRELRRRRGKPLVIGTIKVATVITGAEIGYRLVVELGGGADDREYLIDATELGAALVFFCINRGIPLPASASKSLRVSDDTLALVVDMGASRAQLQRLFGAPRCGGAQPTAPADPPGASPADLPTES